MTKEPTKSGTDQQPPKPATTSGTATPKPAAPSPAGTLPTSAPVEPATTKAAAPIAEKPAAAVPASSALHTHKDESARAKEGRMFDHLSFEPHSRSIVIQNVSPDLDCGRFAIKREVGDALEVTATVFREGHDKLKAVLLWKRHDEEKWREEPMTQVNAGLDLWQTSVTLTENARFLYTVEAWTDVYESWCGELEKKLGAGQNVHLELAEGRQLMEEAAARIRGYDADRLKGLLSETKDADDETCARLLMAPDIRALMARNPDRNTAVRYDRELEVFVDRVRARYAAWYEMFHRSQGTEHGKSATFDDCARRLPEVKQMGFDVVYFVPVHPIGRAFRKGPNNSLDAGPDDPGSPYAIGSEEGGHKAVHPDLGTLEDFRRFVKACHDLDMEVALDFAIQCSPDHPYIKEHPEWFLFRSDGSIKYAENPPKKYQDIVNVDFYCKEWRSLWNELKSIIEFWVEQGVKIFRVDNPHTKPVPFWEWMIRDVQSKHPDVHFLAEAFTRPPMLHMLGKIGFTQSYTYFTWRHSKEELTEYLTELTQTRCKDFMRPNFFASTPDINPPYLQTGGRPAHMIRFVLASTLSSVYGIYNGFELCEATPVPGKEEYLHSEKYEYKVWDWDRPGNIKDYITRINAIRRENPALHELENLRFYESTDDNVLFYGKMTPDRSNMVFIVVNVDPFTAHESTVSFPLEAMGVGEGERYFVEELLSGRRFEWNDADHWVYLAPNENPCEIFRITR